MNSLVITVIFVLCLTPLLYAVSPLAKNVRAKKIALLANIACVLVLCVGSMAVGVSAAPEDGAPAEGETAAADTAETGLSTGAGLGMLGAALVTGMSCIGAGIAVASSASSAIGAVSENPKAFGKALIFVALAEGVALYGMLISIQILDKI